MSFAQTAPKQPTVSHEELLADYARRLQHHLPGRRAVHIHLSRLAAPNRREHHIRIAANSWDPIVKRFEGQIFHLGNNDLIVVSKGASVAELDNIVLKLRFLFSEDPLAEGSAEMEGRTFCTWYDLQKDYSRFLETTQDLLKRRKAGYAEERARDAALSVAKSDAAPAGPRHPLDPTRLARLEQGLVTMDLAPMIRRQPVCAVMPGAPPMPVFQEVFVAIAELTKRLMPDVDLFTDRWLFQRLTESLDQRVLAALPELEGKEKHSTSLNLNVATVLSPGFLTFDKKLRFATQKTMLAEFQMIDVFADLGSFVFARDFLRERGWRVVLDGLNYLTFPVVAGADLNLDLQKVIWTPELQADVQENRRTSFRQAVERVGADKVVLCRCDSNEAISFGQSLGVRLFQGRIVDALIQAPRGN